MGTPLFESETCRRCEGSGTYSYNPRHGNRCYGCGGRGYKLTKRGRAAELHLSDLLSVPAAELKAGQLVRLTAVTMDQQVYGKWHTLTAVELDGDRVTMVMADGRDTVDASDLVRVQHTKAEKREKIDQALAYQATLTKQGKPRKRR